MRGSGVNDPGVTGDPPRVAVARISGTMSVERGRPVPSVPGRRSLLWCRWRCRDTRCASERLGRRQSGARAAVEARRGSGEQHSRASRASIDTRGVLVARGVAAAGRSREGLNAAGTAPFTHEYDRERHCVVLTATGACSACHTSLFNLSTPCTCSEAIHRWTSGCPQTGSVAHIARLAQHVARMVPQDGMKE